MSEFNAQQKDAQQKDAQEITNFNLDKARLTNDFIAYLLNSISTFPQKSSTILNLIHDFNNNTLTIDNFLNFNNKLINYNDIELDNKLHITFKTIHAKINNNVFNTFTRPITACSSSEKPIKILYKHTDLELIKHNTYSFQNDDIKVYDDVVPYKLIQIIDNFCLHGKYSMHASGTKPDVKPSTFLSQDLIDNVYFEKIFTEFIIPKIEIPNKDKLRYNRCYINLHLYGCPGAWHNDGPGLGPTILLYPNSKWKSEWEGATAFNTNLNTSEIRYVDPKPGRIVMFKPYLLHRATDMSVYALREDVWRYTIAYHCHFVE